jgi:hypothetical protein
MPGSMYPSAGAQGPMQRPRGMSALAQLLGRPLSSFDTGESQDDGYQSDDQEVPDPMSAAAILKRGLFNQHVKDSMAPAVPPDMLSPGASPDTSNDFPLAANPSGLGNRNQALTEILGKHYGVPGIADGSISQRDIEAADASVRGHDVMDKSAVATAPVNARGAWDLQHARITGDYGLENRRLAEQGAEHVASINHANDMEKERLHGQMALEAAQAKAAQSIGPDGQPINSKPFGATENRGLEALVNGSKLIEELEKTLDPNKNQVGDWMEKQAKYKLYQMGISPNPVSQEKINLSGLLKILGAAPYVAGSRHFAFMQQAQEHLTNPAATDAFLYRQLQELKKIWPELQQGIIQVHDNPRKPISFSTPAVAADPYSDPNYQPR